MLDAIRRTASTWVVRILLAILIGSFAVWGIGDFVGGRIDTSVAKVGGSEISQPEFDDQLRRELQRLQTQLGRPIDSEQARAIGLNGQVLRTMISRRLLDLEAAQLHIVVPDAVVAAEIRGNQAFFGPTGQFDRLTYERAVMAQGWSPTRFENLLRQDLIREAIGGAVVAGVRGNAPKILVDRIHAYRGETREAEIAVLDPKGEIPAPDDAVLQTFHQENAARFTAPETRSFTYLVLEAEAIADTIEVSDQELKDEYDARHASFSEPERRKVDQMVFPDQAAADAAFGKLRDGGNFLAVAKETLGMEAADVSLGLVEKSGLPEEIGTAAFGLSQGEISKPVQSPFGWHVVRVTEIQPARERAFDEVKADLAQEMKLQKAGSALYQVSNQIQDDIAAGTSVEEIADKLHLQVRKVPAMDSRGRGPEGQPIPGLPAFRDFLGTVNDASPGGDPELREMPEGAYVVIRVDGVTPSALKPFDTVRAEVLETWRLVQQRERAEAAARTLVEKVKGGADFTALVKEAGVESRASGAFKRDGTGADRALSSQLAAALFGVGVGEVVQGPAGDGSGYVVARLKSVNPADATDSTTREQIAKALASGIEEDIAALYRMALEQEHGVTINRQNLERAN
jgi:peptidyl-prolyl cis-trans isomerase D